MPIHNLHNRLSERSRVGSRVCGFLIIPALCVEGLAGEYIDMLSIHREYSNGNGVRLANKGE